MGMEMIGSLGWGLEPCLARSRVLPSTLDTLFSAWQQRYGLIAQSGSAVMTYEAA
jgi:hypothetical protein